MKKRLMLSLAAATLGTVLVAGNASALNWVINPNAPAGGTIANSATDVVGVQEMMNPADSSQIAGIYGAGFVANGSSVDVTFDVDLSTNDSYAAYGNNSAPGGHGWYDVFVVNINQVGYYWDLVNGGTGSIGDPVIDSSYSGGYGIFDTSGTLPGVTWAFGGQDYGGLEQLVVAPSDGLTLSLIGGDPTMDYYVSVIMDTKTSPNTDTSYPSFGSFHVAVPEPATMLLFGTGLVGLFGISRKRRKV